MKTSRILILAFVGSLGSSELRAEPDARAVASAKAAASAEGQAAIERQDWIVAAQHFRELERIYRSANEAFDAALYWQAYALSYAKRDAEVRVVVDRLLKNYPNSTWAGDARALVRENDPAKAVSQSTREEDALMALDALLSSSSDRAVPLLKKVLAGDHSEKVKARAMFVLTQLNPEAAGEALTAILAGPSSRSLKAEAIRMLATGGTRSALDRLLPLYRESDGVIKDAIIEAWIIGERGDLLRQIAETERDPRLRRRTIDALGAVGDSKALLQLFGTLKDVSSQREVLNGLGIAGASEELATIARGKHAPEIRMQAIRSIGIAGGKDVSNTIAAFYDDPDLGVRRSVIEGLIISSGGKQLVQLYRRETDRKMKRELLNAISAVSDEDTLDVIEDALDP
jgi:HEAT repeat protein